MGKYIGKRLSHLVIIWIGLSFLVFLLLYISPLDPAVKKLTAQGEAVNKETVEALHKEMGLDDPFIKQYGRWLNGVVHGKLGVSLRDGRPVADKIQESFNNTLKLSGTALLLALAVSVPLAIFCFWHPDGKVDNIAKFLAFFGNSVPNFLLALILMQIFCLNLKVFPVIAKNSFQGLILPTITLSIPLISKFIRQLRAEFLKEGAKEWMISYKLRGVKMKYRIKSILIGTFPAFLTLIGLSVGTLLGGSVVIETLFRWPGMGKLITEGIRSMDIPVIQGVVLVMTTIYVLVNLTVDIVSSLVDPRITMDGRR